MIERPAKILASILTTSLLVGCLDESDDSVEVVIGSVPCGPEHVQNFSKGILNADYITAAQMDTGAASHVLFVESGDITQNDLIPFADKDDFVLAGRSSYFYQLGRKTIDTFQKYFYSSPEAGLYQTENELGFTLRNAGNDTSPNGHSVGFVNDSTAVISRYDADKAWVVNLDAQLESEFKTCELDLSEYNIYETSPETGEQVSVSVSNMDQVQIHENYAVIVLQRLDQNWVAQDAYAAIFDLNTWEEIDTNPNEDGLKGIKLELKNHQGSAIIDDSLYLTSLIYGVPNTGGIEKVDLNTLTTSIVNTQYGYSKIAITENKNVYATSYTDWEDNALHQITGATNSIIDTVSGEFLYSLSARKNELWLGVGLKGDGSNQPKLSRYNAEDNSKIGSDILVNGTPKDIVFIEK